MNRLTISLPDDLYAMARAYAVANRKSISKAVGDLLRQRSVPHDLPPVPRPDNHVGTYFDPVLGIQVSRSARPLTEEDIQRGMEDEDARQIEMLGLNSMETGKPLKS